MCVWNVCCSVVYGGMCKFVGVYVYVVACRWLKGVFGCTKHTVTVDTQHIHMQACMYEYLKAEKPEIMPCKHVCTNIVQGIDATCSGVCM